MFDPIATDTATGPVEYLVRLLARAPAEVPDRLAELGSVALSDETLTEMRQRPLRDPGQPSGRVSHLDLTAPGRSGEPDVPVRLHCENDVRELRPCLVSIHGGGYVIGTHLGDDSRFERWSPLLRCVGLSVGYRLAPETPYPGPLEDCYAALRFAHHNHTDLGVDAERIGIIGGSAGGGLAAGLGLLAGERGELPIAFQVLSY